MQINFQQAAALLVQGGVGVIPTDTLYGLVGQALNPATTKRIYEIKHRGVHKPTIILIANIHEVERFGVELDPDVKTKLTKLWPAAVTVALPVHKAPSHLPLGESDSLAFRIPNDAELLKLLKLTGPLLAPSANPEGLPPASRARKAQEYFEDQVDFYVENGELSGMASTLILVESGGSTKIIREGADLKKVRDIFF